VVQNTIHSDRQDERLWKKEYRHCELLHHANVILRDFLNDGILFVSKRGDSIVSKNRNVASLPITRSDKTSTSILPPSPQPKTNIQHNLPSVESLQHQSPDTVASKTPSMMPAAMQFSANSSKQVSSKTTDSTSNANKVPPPPPTNLMGNTQSQEKQISSQQAINNASDVSGSATKISTSKPPPPPTNLPKSRLNMNILKTSTLHGQINSAPSSMDKISVKPPPPPPPKSLPGNRLKIDLSQFKPKPPSVTASAKQLSIEERRRLAKEGRKLFLKARSGARQSSIAEESSKAMLKSKVSEVPKNNVKLEDVPNNPPPPPPMSTTPAIDVAEEGWDFDDDDASSPPLTTSSENGESNTLIETQKSTGNGKKLMSTSNDKIKDFSKRTPPPPPPPISNAISDRGAAEDGWDFDDDDASSSFPPTSVDGQSNVLEPKNSMDTLEKKILPLASNQKDIINRPPPPPPVSINSTSDVAGDGWDFEDDDASKEHLDNLSVPTTSSNVPNDGWDFDDF